MRCEGGVARLGDAPGAPLGAPLPAGTHPELVVGVGVDVQNQELTIPTDVRVLELTPPAAGAPVLQPIICCCEVLIHLMPTGNNKYININTNGKTNRSTLYGTI